MKTATLIPILTACLVCSLSANTAAAETVYVSDRFEIGVHENTELDSVIVAVIPSGTALTVVDRDGDYVEVTTPDGIKGWVGARYVVNEKPSVAMLEERDEKLVQATRSLGDARAEVEVLRQRVSELQRDAATAARSASAATTPVALESNEDTAKLKETERQLETLSRENRVLKVQMADLQATKAELEESAAATAPENDRGPAELIWQGPMSNEGRAWTPWQWLLFGSILLLAFAAGGYAVDWESRRRHGGFRI
jgi:SH3 domain protein